MIEEPITNINNNNQRDISLDIIKIISAYMVVFYHLGHLDLGSFYNGYYHCSIGQLVLIICSSSIPMFFMVNGSLVLNKPYTYQKMCSKAGKIALLIFIWSFLEFPSWFMKTLIIIYLLFPVIIMVYNKSRLRTLVMLALLFFPFGYNFLIVMIKMLKPDLTVQIMNYNISLNVIPNRTGLFTMYSLLYFMIGGIVVNKRVKPLVSLICIVSGYMLVLLDVFVSSNYSKEIQDAVNACFPTIGALLLSFGLFSIFKSLNFEKYKKASLIIGKINYIVLPIYLFHMFFIRCLFKVLHTNQISLLETTTFSILVCIACGLIAKILQKTPYVNEFIRI